MKIDSIYVPGKGDCLVVPGTEVTGERVIAGGGRKTVFRSAARLAQTYGGRPESWKKMRGEVLLMVDDEIWPSEIHWAEEGRIGGVEIKFVERIR